MSGGSRSAPAPFPQLRCGVETWDVLSTSIDNNLYKKNAANLKQYLILLHKTGGPLTPNNLTGEFSEIHILKCQHKVF